MKKKAWIGIVALVATMVLAAIISCSSKKETTVINIGVIMPLTGDAAIYGVPSFNAMKLAVSQAEADLLLKGVRIELIPEDSQAKPAMGVSAIQKLISVNRVKVVLGPLASSVTLAVSPIAESNKVVLLSPSSSAPAITSAGDYIFRTELSEYFGGLAQADLAIDKLSYKKVACIYINNDYGASLFEVFKERFSKRGGIITFAEAFAQGTTDFRATLAKISTVQSDAIFVISHDEILNFVRQKVQLGIKVPIYTTPMFEDRRNLEKLGPLANGVIYTYYGSFDPNVKLGPTGTFIQDYEATFGEPPTYYAALAYDATRILLKTLEITKFQPAELKDALYQVKSFEGVTGDMSFDKNGDILKPVSLKTVEDGKFAFLQEAQ